jgi:hypothetical protein
MIARNQYQILRRFSVGAPFMAPGAPAAESGRDKSRPYNILMSCFLCCLVAGCNGAAEPPRTMSPSAVAMRPPRELGAPQRPLVEFPHGVHTDALSREGCQACHGFDESKRLIPGLAADAADMDAYMKFFHDKCTGCHLERPDEKTGPVTCGECHLERPDAAASARSPMNFDYSLHYRHVRASGEKCSACHHVYDSEQKKLVYRQGTEDACNVCHGEQDDRDRISLRTAVHTDCVSCHLQRRDRGEKTGPWLCAGCHAAAAQNEIEKIKEPPRLDRGQPDAMWIAAKGATARVVPFDHRLHEGQADSCSACHHKSIGKCDECHPLASRPEGGGISLEQAYHLPGSTLSCVGCHRERSNRGQCAGCHRALPQAPGQAACQVCHHGPLPQPVENRAALTVSFPPVQPSGLPAVSEDFPAEIEIGVLAEKYRPSGFPHQKVVAALDKGVRESRLATRFHQDTGTLCTGCHHHSPPDIRVPSCNSCHGDAAHPQKDLPDLTEAYHRQCIGCHQAIGHKAQGCTDCHGEVRQ